MSSLLNTERAVVAGPMINTLTGDTFKRDYNYSIQGWCSGNYGIIGKNIPMMLISQPRKRQLVVSPAIDLAPSAQSLWLPFPFLSFSSKRYLSLFLSSCSETLMRKATNFARKKLISMGTCVGKFTKTGKFHLQVTALDVMAPYAKVQVCVCVCVFIGCAHMCVCVCMRVLDNQKWGSGLCEWEKTEF